MMKLLRFRVTNFRSVEDSGWIETDTVTALIGTNESGKTNLLLPLWKLKPAKNGQINALADYPRSRYGEIRDMDKKPIFIEACFELSGQPARHIAALARVEIDEVLVISVKRDFAGDYWISFPEASVISHVSKSEIITLLSEAYTSISQIAVETSKETPKNKILSILVSAENDIRDLPQDRLDADTVLKIKSRLAISESDIAEPDLAPITACYAPILAKLESIHASITEPYPNETEEVKKAVLNCLPPFVYYSNYGNLDSEIYLPHVIQNMQRTDLGQREEAKARTLKVLFDFVKLKPQEILELGYDFDPRVGQNPNSDQVKEVAERKKRHAPQPHRSE